MPIRALPVMELRLKLLEKNLSHHAFVFVVQQMTVKQRHALDDVIAEIKNHVNRAAKGNVDRV